MKKIFLVCCVALFAPLAHAIEITVGSTPLSIPVPSEFAPVTSDMKPYAEVAQRFVPPTNEQFALFISSADAALAAKGKMPESDRKFSVQTTKAIISSFASTEEFAELKRMLKTQNAQLIEKVEEQMPGFFKKLNQGMADDYKVNLELSMTQLIPFPPHYETDRALAYAMIIKYNVNDADGKPSVWEGVATVTFVHVRGKVLFLYANAEKTGLEWSKTESRKWADLVIAANPSTAESAKQETRQRSSGFDWSKVWEKGLVGAVIGGVIGLLAYFFKKKSQ